MLAACLMDGDTIHTESQGSRQVSQSWRRTVDGWELANRWYVKENRVAQLHPLVPAALLALISIAGLLVFPPAIRCRFERT